MMGFLNTEELKKLNKRLKILAFIQVELFIFILLFLFKGSNVGAVLGFILGIYVMKPIIKTIKEIREFKEIQNDFNDMKNHCEILLKTVNDKVNKLNYGREKMDILLNKYQEIKSPIHLMFLKLEIVIFSSEIEKIEKEKYGKIEESYYEHEDGSLRLVTFPHKMEI